jgi:cytochrome c biogenesis protein CcmG/thiol:disulfide interchange protein DsbE
MRGKTSWALYLLAAAAAALVVLVAWVNRDRLSPVAPGREAPDFFATDLAGTRKTLDDYRGKVILVNIWATWCPPCQQEMPSIQRLYEAIDDDDFEVLAVSIDAAFGQRDAFGRVGGDLRLFADSLGLTFTILHDPSGKIQDTFQTTGVPESFLLDRRGIIKKKVAGSTAWDAPQNLALVQRLLGED